jgi:hypothetical protein
MENLNEKAGRHMERNQFSKVLKFLSTRTKSFTDEVKIEMVNQKTFCHIMQDSQRKWLCNLGFSSIKLFQ